MEPDDLIYEDYEDFNLSIDDDVGDVRIRGETFRASEVLFNMKRETYRIALSEFEIQEFDNLQQLAFDSFPACIAYNYRMSEKGQGATDAVRKFMYLKDTWEAIIYVLYALVWGEVRAKQVDLKRAEVVYRNNLSNFKTGIVFTDALHQKLENIKAVIKYSTDNALNLNCEQDIKQDLLIDLLELQNNRNNFSHLAAPTHEQAKEELGVVLPIFKRVLKNLRFLSETSILRFESYSTECHFETLNGHSLNKEYDTIPVVEVDLPIVLPHPREVIFARWHGQFMSLSPFLHFIDDQTGHETYLCYYKGSSNHGTIFHYEPVKRRGDQIFASLQYRFDTEKTGLQNLIQ